MLTLQGTVTILGVVIAYWYVFTAISTFGLTFGLGWTAAPTSRSRPSRGASHSAPKHYLLSFLVRQLAGLPGTPRWLVQHDCHEEARKVVAAISNQDLHSLEVEGTVADIQAILAEE